MPTTTLRGSGGGGTARRTWRGGKKNETKINSRCGRAGVEEYTQQHMDIIQPLSLGFKGHYQDGRGNVPEDANKLLQEFFAPLNAQLGEMLADHPIPWQPFKPHVAAEDSPSAAMAA